MQSPDFRNCDAGVGDLFVGNQNCGFIEKFSARIVKDALKLYNKTPEEFRGQILTKRGHVWNASLYEASMENISLFSGVDRVINIDGSTVTVTSGAAAPSPKTFAIQAGDGNAQSITLEGPNVASLTLSHSSGSPTYTNNTDYILVNYTTGKSKVYRNPGGAIGSLAQVRTGYTYTPPASKRLLIGDDTRTTLATLTDLRFEHENPANDAKKRNCFMPKAQVSGDLKLDFEDGKFQIWDIEIEALPDETKSVKNGGDGDRLGYWDWED